MQNKKIVRQRDCLRALKKKYDKEDKQFEKQNIEITKDYKRIAQSYRELQLRFRNVAYTDFNAFREVWNLNEKRLHDQVLKILEADRVIMEQQLGKEPRNVDPEYLKRWIIGTEEFEDLTKTPQAPAPKSKEETGQVDQNTGILSTASLSEPLEHLRRMITDEVGFLVNERVKNILGGNMYDTTDESKQTFVPLNPSLNFVLSIFLSPAITTKMALSFTKNDNVFAISSSLQFITWAASLTVAEELSNSKMFLSKLNFCKCSFAFKKDIIKFSPYIDLFLCLL